MRRLMPPCLVCPVNSGAQLTASSLQRPKLITDAWQRILDIEAAGEVVDCTIEVVNRGGVIVNVEGISGEATRQQRQCQHAVWAGFPADTHTHTLLIKCCRLHMLQSHTSMVQCMYCRPTVQTRE